jgi:quercetin dioxygenase-like cupin family protein
MDESVRLIAERMRGMREALDVTPAHAAKTCEVSQEQYLQYESGDIDIPVGILHRMAKTYHFDIASLLTGEEPHMHTYSLTREGRGVIVERRRAYNYEAHAANFVNRKADPFVVIVEPKEDKTVAYNSHPGQEFNYLLSGRLKFFIGDSEMVLEPGDSIYFDSGKPHAMLAMDGKAAKFLAIIL